MGQRSQIYLRHNGDLVFASYFQWNYGERMISRARWGIEYLKEFVDEHWNFVFRDKSYIERIRRVFDTNFDMHDVAISCDIVKEYYELFNGDDFNDTVFNKQENNDGQLFVDIQDNKIYYCFRGWDLDSGKEKLMTAAQYMAWDAGKWRESEYITEDAKAACTANIKAIGKIAELMTREQLDDFLHGDYEEKPF